MLGLWIIFLPYPSMYFSRRKNASRDCTLSTFWVDCVECVELVPLDTFPLLALSVESSIVSNVYIMTYVYYFIHKGETNLISCFTGENEETNGSVGRNNNNNNILYWVNSTESSRCTVPHTILFFFFLFKTLTTKVWSVHRGLKLYEGHNVL